jgi:hypothetical protein
LSNNPFFADATTNAGLNSLAATANGGTLNIYTGTQPADANTALSGNTLLVTLTLSATAFANGVASGSAGSKVCTATANAITAGTGVATGTATFFRILTSGSAVCIDGSVGTSGSDLNLSSTSISTGAVVSISSFTITQTE